MTSNMRQPLISAITDPPPTYEETLPQSDSITNPGRPWSQMTCLRSSNEKVSTTAIKATLIIMIVIGALGTLLTAALSLAYDLEREEYCDREYWDKILKTISGHLTSSVKKDWYPSYDCYNMWSYRVRALVICGTIFFEINLVAYGWLVVGGHRNVINWLASFLLVFAALLSISLSAFPELCIVVIYAMLLSVFSLIYTSKLKTIELLANNQHSVAQLI